MRREGEEIERERQDRGDTRKEEDRRERRHIQESERRRRER